LKKDIKATYVANLWIHTTYDDLLWKTKGVRVVRRLAQYRAPTWPWASLDGEVCWIRRHRVEGTEYIAYPFDLGAKLAGMDPFGGYPMDLSQFVEN
jgi:hypothetical protein